MSMLFTFKSANSADLIMHEKNAKEILALLGKTPEDARGIITLEQLPAAIVTLQSAMKLNKSQEAENSPQSGHNDIDDEPPIGLSQRAIPFIELLERALKAGKPVVWGV